MLSLANKKYRLIPNDGLLKAGVFQEAPASQIDRFWLERRNAQVRNYILPNYGEVDCVMG